MPSKIIKFLKQLCKCKCMCKTFCDCEIEAPQPSPVIEKHTCQSPAPPPRLLTPMQSPRVLPRPMPTNPQNVYVTLT